MVITATPEMVVARLPSATATLSPTATPGQHAWRVVTRVAVADPRLQINVAPDELLYRLAQLYALHQFAAWAPRNNFLARARGESNSGIAP